MVIMYVLEYMCLKMRGLFSRFDKKEKNGTNDTQQCHFQHACPFHNYSEIYTDKERPETSENAAIFVEMPFFASDTRRDSHGRHFRANNSPPFLHLPAGPVPHIVVPFPS